MNEHGRAAQEHRVGAKLSRANYCREQSKGKAVGRRVSRATGYLKTKDSRVTNSAQTRNN